MRQKTPLRRLRHKTRPADANLAFKRSRRACQPVTPSSPSAASAASATSAAEGGDRAQVFEAAAEAAAANAQPAAASPPSAASPLLATENSLPSTAASLCEAAPATPPASTPALAERSSELEHELQRYKHLLTCERAESAHWASVLAENTRLKKRLMSQGDLPRNEAVARRVQGSRCLADRYHGLGEVGHLF